MSQVGWKGRRNPVFRVLVVIGDWLMQSLVRALDFVLREGESLETWREE